MCRPTNCRTCGNTTWAGCGSHVDQVMAGVPRDQRCTCDKTGSTSAASTSSAVGDQPRSFLDRFRSNR